MRVKRGVYGVALKCKGRGNGRFPRKPANQRASSSTISTCENPGANPPGIEPSSPWWETTLSIALCAPVRQEQREFPVKSVAAMKERKWNEALSASKQIPPGRPSAPDITAGNQANEAFVVETLRQQDVRRWGRAVRRHASSLHPTTSWTSFRKSLLTVAEIQETLGDSISMLQKLCDKDGFHLTEDEVKRLKGVPLQIYKKTTAVNTIVENFEFRLGDKQNRALSLPARTADCERGFSRAKSIETEWRNNLHDHALSSLMRAQLHESRFDPRPAINLWYHNAQPPYRRCEERQKKCSESDS
ncbi:hypothetical protein PR048_024496 [Dryococelus australis]|uniref:HAT C-terminal dimerisation domain-containing protein n=1 Tax=Dryococelus australis TaxID=614101 RepID=A0ABQ9GNS3_9NEOP|nr:hypothetical protein PR048_024496 [Dryococelus australis]